MNSLKQTHEASKMKKQIKRKSKEYKKVFAMKTGESKASVLDLRDEFIDDGEGNLDAPFWMPAGSMFENYANHNQFTDRFTKR